MVDDDRTPSPEETLRLIEEQRTATVRRLRGDPLLIMVPWGAAWFLGFGAFFLRYGLDGTPDGPISLTQALTVVLATNVVAGACTAAGFRGVGRGIRGESTARGAMYTWTWVTGVALMWVICTRFSFELPEAEVTLLWSGSMVLIVALLYMAGGAITGARPMFFMGLCGAAVNGVGVVLGVGWHALLTAVLLGGGQIAAGLWFRWRG